MPPAESMASGCVLLSTDIPGVADYAWAGQTAALVPAEDSAALARELLELISDGPRRLTLAAAGRDLIHGRFTLDAATDRLESALTAG